MKVYVVSPFGPDTYGPSWGEPERVFSDRERAAWYRSAGGMEVTELDLDEDVQEGTAVTALRVGQVLYGYCGGAFGRDSYGDKTVEAVGADWVVVRENGCVGTCSGNPADLLKYTQRSCWCCGHRPVETGGMCPQCREPV